MSKIDLHIHTIASTDGDDTVEKILNDAKQSGMEVIAIADHNRVVSVKEAQIRGKELGIKVLSGIEIDCEYKGVGLHVLGYGVDIENAKLLDLQQYYDQQDQQNTWLAVQKLQDHFKLSINREALEKRAKNGIIVPEDVGDELLKDPQYNDCKWLKPYREQGNRSDNPNVNFYWDYFSQGKVAHVSGRAKTAQEIIDLIHECKGVAFIAHPGMNLKNNLEYLTELVSMGLDGIEVYSSYHTSEQVDYFYAEAKKYHILVSCGSDYHGKHKPSIAIGKIKYIKAEAECFGR